MGAGGARAAPHPDRRAARGGPHGRVWIECGFRCLKSVDWDWEETQHIDFDRVARHWLALAVTTAWVIVTGSAGEGRPGT